MKDRVMFGIDHFLQQAGKYSQLRFALVTNNAATTSAGVVSSIALRKESTDLIRIFSPEHGLEAKGEDGVRQNDGVDPVTGLPVISLYGDRLAPSKKDLDDVDAVLFDIPDVGCRFYTYLWTMTYVMEACAEFNKPLFILDRPNPIGGDLHLVEGPMLDEINCSSFIGRWSIPIRHGCTLGELARYFAATHVKNCELQIVKIKNWNRQEPVEEGSWLFIPPSPAIQNKETVLFYPGMGLLEGVNVNEGRGTPFPFLAFGAPWIKAAQMQEAFMQLQLPGAISEPYSYIPISGLHAEEFCHGLRLTITDANAFRPVQTGFKLIQLITRLYADSCKERLYITRANPTGKDHLDKLTGIHHSFEKVRSGGFEGSLSVASDWRSRISPYLLY
jgi:uncharacterized protein YbbC (DUF1343 family)